MAETTGILARGTGKSGLDVKVRSSHLVLPLGMLWLAALHLSGGESRAQIILSPHDQPVLLGMNLKKAKVGAWCDYVSEYATAYSTSMPGTKQKVALVGRTGSVNTIQIVFEPRSEAVPSAVQEVSVDLDPGSPERFTRFRTWGDDEAVTELSPKDRERAAKDQLRPPDPSKLVGREEVTVRAGTLKASRFSYKEDGLVLDYWMSEEAPPLGLVKVRAVTGGEDLTQFSTEATSCGDGAKPLLPKRSP